MKICGTCNTKHCPKETVRQASVARAKVFPQAHPRSTPKFPRLEGILSPPAHLCRSWKADCLARRCSWSESRIGAIIQQQGPRSRQAAGYIGCGVSPGCWWEHGPTTLKGTLAKGSEPLPVHLVVTAAKCGVQSIC